MAIEGRIGVVGGGNMGSALINGLLAAGLAKPEQVVVAEQDQARAAELVAQTRVSVVDDPQALEGLRVLIIAVKPLDVEACAQAASSSVDAQGLVITLAAGVPLAKVAACFDASQPIVRAMPNTPALIGEGVTALAPGEAVSQADLDLACSIFKAVGKVVVVTEKAMDAVTGLSGSGPAYVFLFAEALADAGVAQGLDRQTALTLALGTVAGAASLALQSDKHLAQLKDMVTSPGGTTIAGLHVLERGGLRGLVMDAVAAATKRGEELGK